MFFKFSEKSEDIETKSSNPLSFLDAYFEIWKEA